MIRDWRDIVVAPQPAAVEAGATVLASGGNAVDAAISAAFVQGIATPQSCGVGGFGSLHVWDAAATRHTVLQFPGLAGSLVRPGMWQDRWVQEYRDGYGFQLRDFENDIGWQSVTTPGAVAGLWEAHQRWGTQPWASLVEPAVTLAAEGFPLTPALQNAWHDIRAASYASPRWRLTNTPAAAAIYTSDGSTPLRRGDRFVQRDYAQTLRRIADGGVDEFYRGALGREIGEAIRRHGGYVTPDDLAAYRVREPQPVVGAYRGLRIVSDPLPHGGATLIQILNVLEGFDLLSLGHNSPRYIDLVARAMQWAYRDWATRLGDPGFTPDCTAEITSKGYAANAAARLADGERFAIPRLQPPEPPDTTHLTVVDRWGNAASLTHSLGASSGVVVDGLGFQLNNCMNCFHPLPGRPNSIAPGKARLSGLAPTIVYANDVPAIVIGAPGGTRIITGVLQVLLNIIDFGMSPTEAVTAPRFDSQSHIIDLDARHPLTTLRRLAEMGHQTVREGFPYGRFAHVQVALRNPETGRWYGASDPGSGGMPLSSEQLD